jgi:hypothetical protein
MEKRKNILLSFFILTSWAFSTNAEASQLFVVNENEGLLNIQVVPEDIATSAPYCAKDIAGVCGCPGQSSAEFIVKPEFIQGKRYYAVEGTSEGILFGSSCRYLDVSKDYAIRFHPTLFGTSCETEEIPAAEVITMISFVG